MGEKEDGTLAVFRFEKILIFLDLFIEGAGEVTKKLKEKEKERKEEKVAWKIILIREKLKRDYEVERRIGMGTSRLSRHVYHVTFLFSL